MGAISLISAAAFFAWLIWAARTRPTFLFCGIFLIWQFALKVVSTTYLDLFGPVHAIEVDAEVGGHGSSTLLLVLFLWVPLAVLYFCLGPRQQSRPPLPEVNTRGITFATVSFWAFALFFVLLFGDMLRIGVIPFFAGIERFEYVGGVFHKLLFDFTWMFSFLLGFVLARTRAVTGAWDLRFVGLVLTLFLYLFLAGHRFGAFYVTLSFISLGIAGNYFAQQQGWSMAAPVQNSALQRFARSPTVIAIAAAALVTIVAVAMIHNMFVVRQYGSMAGDALEQRLLVQPVELYWLTWDRWISGETISGADAIYFMFNDPFDAARNSGIQYLMYLYLGENAAFARFVEGGQDYAGGYPEILIELGGVWIALGAASLVAAVTGLLYRLIVSSVARGHFLTAVIALYFCYGLLGIYLGGMLNFLIVWSYWIKLGALIVAFVLDRLAERSGFRFFPWMFLRRGAASMTPAAAHGPAPAGS
jgi:hypothetical protein